MTRSEFEFFLTCAMAVCAAMAVVTLFRVRKRGVSAYFLAAGFIALGFLLYGFHENWSKQAMALSGGALVICLVGDFLIRATVHGQAKR